MLEKFLELERLGEERVAFGVCGVALALCGVHDALEDAELALFGLVALSLLVRAHSLQLLPQLFALALADERLVHRTLERGGESALFEGVLVGVLALARAARRALARESRQLQLLLLVRLRRAPVRTFDISVIDGAFSLTLNRETPSLA